MGHVRRLHGPQAAGKLPCATTLSSLDAAVVTRRRRRVTSFAFPSGGGASGSVSTPPTSLCDDGGPGASTQTAPTAPTARTAARACRGRRPRWRSAPRTALKRPRTPRTAIATAAALAQSTWVDSAGRSRFPPLGAHLRRDVRMAPSDADCDDGGPGSEFQQADCPYGSDCTDCGPRMPRSPAAAPPRRRIARPLPPPSGRMLVIIRYKLLFRVAPYMNEHE